MRMSVIQDYTIPQGTYSSPVTGSQPQVLEGGGELSCRITLDKVYKYLRFKPIRTYHYRELFSIIKTRKCTLRRRLTTAWITATGYIIECK